MTERYYLALPGSPKKEVTKEEFVATERRCGFYNSIDQPSEPATAGFSSHLLEGQISGWVTRDISLGGLLTLWHEEGTSELLAGRECSYCHEHTCPSQIASSGRCNDCEDQRVYLLLRSIPKLVHAVLHAREFVKVYNDTSMLISSEEADQLDPAMETLEQALEEFRA